MHANGQIHSWPTLLHAIELLFAPSQYDDPNGALFKLLQTGSVREYQAQFETLANRIVGLPPTFFLSCFISGLKREIRRAVQALQPISLSPAIGLAKLQEDKLLDLPFYTRTVGSGPHKVPLSPSNSPISQFSSPRTSSVPVSTTSSTHSNSMTKPLPQIKRLSPEELQGMRDKGLYYNCDEKYHSGHRCKRQFMILIAMPEVGFHEDDALSALFTAGS